MRTVVIIPAFNEERSIGKVLADIPMDVVQEVVVVDNNSTDATFAEAQKGGATVLKQPIQGYGSACLKGIEYFCSQNEKPDIVVFMDADYSDHPDELPNVIAPILHDKMDMVIGSRALGPRERGSMTPQQVFGNWLACTLMRIMYKARYTDLGPFRAITWPALMQIEMKDPNYGWTVEMQLKALKHKLRHTEVPVTYRKRIGTSKIAGTLKGTVMAGYKIITTIFKYL